MPRLTVIIRMRERRNDLAWLAAGSTGKHRAHLMSLVAGFDARLAQFKGI